MRARYRVANGRRVTGEAEKRPSPSSRGQAPVAQEGFQKIIMAEHVSADVAGVVARAVQEEAGASCGAGEVGWGGERVEEVGRGGAVALAAGRVGFELAQLDQAAGAGHAGSSV